MKKSFVFSVLIILAAMFNMPVMADWDTPDGHKMHAPQYPDIDGWDVRAKVPITLADDWQCIETGWVKEIHWWGSWKNDIEDPITVFILGIHEDIPADPQNPACHSRPGEMLWFYPCEDYIVAEPVEPPNTQGWYDPSTAEIINDDHENYWQYNVFLPELEWFWQEEGNIYWLSIMCVNNDHENMTWGWKTTQNHWNDDAVYANGSEYNWLHMYEPPGWPSYVPGDVDGDCDVDMDDVNYLSAHFQGGPAPPLVVPGPFYPAADANGDCYVTATDVTYLILFLEHGGAEPTFCWEYPPEGWGTSLDLSFVINGGAEDIPTLNEWGMIILALLILAVGTIAVIRRRRTVSVVE